MDLKKLFFMGLVSALGLSFSACDDDDDGSSDGGVQYPTPANDLCRDAIDLPIDQTVSGTTLGAHSEYWDNTDDVYYKVTIENAGWYEFVMTRSSENISLGMEIWKSCAPADEQDLFHPDVIRDEETDLEDDSPLDIRLELQPGTYLINAQADLFGYRHRISGSDFTIAYHAYQETTPEISSAQASFKYVPASGNQIAYSLISFRISGQDAGKDASNFTFTLQNAANELIEMEGRSSFYACLHPKYEANGQFKDAFSTNMIYDDLSSAVTVQLYLIDGDNIQSLPATIELSRDFEKVSRNAGESCDFTGQATSCPTGMRCGSIDDFADVCVPVSEED